LWYHIQLDIKAIAWFLAPVFKGQRIGVLTQANRGDWTEFLGLAGGWNQLGVALPPLVGQTPQ